MKTLFTFSQTCVLVGERGDHHQTEWWNDRDDSESLEWDCLQPHTHGPRLLSAWDPAFCHWGTNYPWYAFNISDQRKKKCVFSCKCVFFFSFLTFLKTCMNCLDFFLSFFYVTLFCVCFCSLNVSQVCGHNFDAGELGPGTIVGSAAFNMFVIIGLCVWVIPEGESRKIKHLRVFFITAFWSIFAYIWLYLILAVISPGIVEVCFVDCIFTSNKSMCKSDKPHTACITRFGRLPWRCFIFRCVWSWLGSLTAVCSSTNTCTSVTVLTRGMALWWKWKVTLRPKALMWSWTESCQMGVRALETPPVWQSLCRRAMN